MKMLRALEFVTLTVLLLAMPSTPGAAAKTHMPPNILRVGISPTTPLANAMAIVAGYFHTCALTTNGGVKCWGRNNYGQIGDDTTADRVAPVNVSGLTNGISTIAAGNWHTCALTASGGVKCWGQNNFGQIGDGTTTNRWTPVDVIGLESGVRTIAADGSHTCALTASGGVKCWGDNYKGELGDGTTTDHLSPVDVIGLASGVRAIAADGSHTCALTASGGVKCWGANGSGQIGDGTTMDRWTPVDVSGLTSGVSAIATGGTHTCALTTSGDIKCWGANGSGQLGDGTMTQRLTPVDVSSLTTGMIAIATGWNHTCALTASGGAMCWGDNVYSQLGDGTMTQRLTPVDVSGLTSGISAIAAGFYDTCALTMSGGLKCWGFNGYGELGDGTTTQRLTPVDVVEFGGVLPVPLYYQGHPSTPNTIPDPMWGQDLYGHPNIDLFWKNETMGRWGCHISSMAMIMTYLNQRDNQSATITPRYLNNWLRSNDGYTFKEITLTGGGKDWQSYPKPSQFTTFFGRYFHLVKVGNIDDIQVNNYLANGLPVILHVNGGQHYVVATGRTIVNGTNTYTINDPMYGQTTLCDNWGCSYNDYQVWDTGTAYDKNPTMKFSAYSPVHLVVTDPQGQKVGYDPRTNTTWNEIAGAGYIIESITTVEGHTMEDKKILYISNTIQGFYNVQVIGYASGGYEIVVDKRTSSGVSTSESFIGVAQNGSVNNYLSQFADSVNIFLPFIRR